MGGHMKKKIDEQVSEVAKEETIAETGPVTLTGEPVTVPLKEVEQDKSPRVTALRKELEADRDKLLAELKDYREYYDKHVNDAKFLESQKKIKEISKKLAPLQNELAKLARASGGNKGMKAEPGQIGVKLNS
jgi:hypothetical protein